jgi:hypothetical protein
MRRPPPWTVESLDAGYKVVDANGQALAYVCGHADQSCAGIAKALILDRGSRAASPSCPSFSPRRQQSPLSELTAKLVIMVFVGQGVGGGYPVRLLDSGSSNVSCRA